MTLHIHTYLHVNLFTTVFVIMQIALGIDKDTIQHNYLAYMYIEPLKLIQRYDSLCRVSTSVPLETVGVHPKTLPESIMFFPFFFFF